VGASGSAISKKGTPAEYVVVAGDYLLGIAKKLNVGFRDLLDLNQLTPTSALFPGDVLKVPSTKARTPAPAAPKAPAPAAPKAPAPAAPKAPATTAPAQPLSYTIQAGDSIFAIAKRYGLKYGSILKLNNITLDSMLQPGTVLLLPAGATLVKPAAAPPPATTVPAPAVPPKAVPPTTVPPATVPPTTVPPGNAVAPSAGPLDPVIAFAKAQVGKPYQYFTAGPDSYDCSGLTLAAYKQIGVKLVHQSLAQSQQGRAVDWTVEPIKAGDLVFMYSTRNPGVISHVGIAISTTRWVHAPRPGDVVREGPLPPSERIIAVRRFVET
jgi:cell wall-associated NlpC family hydrolase